MILTIKGLSGKAEMEILEAATEVMEREKRRGQNLPALETITVMPVSLNESAWMPRKG